VKQTPSERMQLCSLPASPFGLLLRRKPPGIPPVAWRRVRTLRVVARIMMSVVLFYTVAMLTVGSLRDALLSLDMAFTSTGICYVILVMSLIAHSRLRAVVRAARSVDWSMCEGCGYDLRGLPEGHNCPECGEQYDLDRTRALWRGMEVSWATLGKWRSPFSVKTQWIIVVTPLALALLAVLMLAQKGAFSMTAL